MAFSKSLRSYDDAREIFDAALAAGGVQVDCTQLGQAVNLRARLNHFRVLDRNYYAEAFPASDPRHGVSPYDGLMVRLVGSTLIVEKRQIGGYTITPLKPQEG